MRKNIITFAIVFLIAHTLESNPIIFNNLIPWGVREIIWSDFKGKPDYKQRYSAISFTYTTIRPVKSYKDSIIVAVDVFFVGDKSWVKPSLLSDQLLRHERIHFDISELYGRKIRKLYATYKYSKSKIQIMIEQQKDSLSAEMRKLDHKYDLETDYSKNDSVQRIWDLRIKCELEELCEFSSTHVTLKTDSKK